MDYECLAEEFLENLKQMLQIPMRKNTDRFVRGEMFVLDYLSKNGAVTPGQISSEMNVSTARTAKLLATLELKGLIVRTQDGSDKRKRGVTLTQKGASYLGEHKSFVLATVAAALSSLGERDAMEYVRITKKLLDCITEETRTEENFDRPASLQKGSNQE